MKFRLLLTRWRTLFGWHQVVLLLFLLWDPFQDTPRLSVVLSSSSLKVYPSVFLELCDLESFDEYWSVFSRMPLTLGLFDVVSWFDWDLGFGEGT